MSDNPQPPPPDPLGGKASARPDGVDWTMVRLKFVTGTMSLKDLALAEGLPRGTVRQRASREGWVRARNSVGQGVTEAVLCDTRASRMQELAEFNRANIDFARKIHTLAEAHATAAIERGATIPPIDLRTLSAAMESAQRIARLALGVSTTNAEVTGAGGADLNPGPTLADFYKMAATLRQPAPEDAPR